jgi:Ras-related protein Rab-1A
MISNESSDFLLKFLLIGEPESGKTCLLLNFVKDPFNDRYLSTIGVDFKVHTMALGSSRVRLQIWDTGGAERFRTITSSYYRGAHGIAIVFNVRDRKSFEAIPQWKHEIERYASDSVEVILIGTKIDDITTRLVTYEEGKAKADSIGVRYIETSAKTSVGVQEAFVTLSQQIITNMKSRSSRPPIASSQAQIVNPALSQVLIVGDARAGKTALVKRISRCQYEESYNGTVTFDVCDISVQCKESTVALRLYDCSGRQESFSFCQPDFAVILFDVTSAESFRHVDVWLTHIRAIKIPSDKKILVGNKCDVKCSNRAVSFEEARAKAFSLGLTYQETSCWTGDGVTELFAIIAQSFSEETIVSNPYLLPRIANTFVSDGVRYLGTIPGLRVDKEGDTETPVYKQGSSAVVYRGSYHGISVAIKQYKCSFLSLHGYTNNESDQLHMETYTYNVTKNFPSALTLYGSFIANQITHPFIITELADQYGTLAEVLSNNTLELTWEWRINVLYGIASFLDCLHTRGIAHMDLKSENSLVMAIEEGKLMNTNPSQFPHQM